MSQFSHNQNYPTSISDNLQTSLECRVSQNYGIQNFPKASQKNPQVCRVPFFTSSTMLNSIPNQHPSVPFHSTRTLCHASVSTLSGCDQVLQTINRPPSCFRPGLSMPYNNSSVSSYLPPASQQESSSSCQQQPAAVVLYSTPPFCQQEPNSFAQTPSVSSQSYVHGTARNASQPSNLCAVPQNFQFQPLSVPPPTLSYSSSAVSSKQTNAVPLFQDLSQLRTQNPKVSDSTFVPENSITDRSQPLHCTSFPPFFSGVNTFSVYSPRTCNSFTSFSSIVCPSSAVIPDPKHCSSNLNSINNVPNSYQVPCNVPRNDISVAVSQRDLNPRMQNHIPQLTDVPPSEACDISLCLKSPGDGGEDASLKNLLKHFKKRVVVSPMKKNCMSVAEYVVLLKDAFYLIQDLSNQKNELENLVHGDGKIWDHKVKNIVKQQNALCEIFDKITDSVEVSHILSKLQKIKRKRLRVKQQKEHFKHLKCVQVQKCIKLHGEIDRWREVLREKAEQQKRETEMKKEADYILAEVRKKIHEAKRTIEKLKVFEKLRHARKENALKKGMLFLPLHDRNFESKLSEMRQVMLKQLSDYEAEERALKVMLETEQEGQREIEAEWRLKKLKVLQEKRHAEIESSLFGDCTLPSEDEPLFLFHQYYNCSTKSVDSLIQIRRAWDVYLVATDDTEGSSVPQKWVVPSPPSNEIWSSALTRNIK